MKKSLFFLILFLAFTLRYYKLGLDPPSLYWDEVSLGYNAYSILKTGMDEHGVRFPLSNFAAFGDYKPPLYVYASVPSIALFDLTPFAVRFPSAFFGLLTVLTTYFLAKKIFAVDKIAMLAAFFLAISPWHLQFSRAAFEANIGLFFSSLGILLFIKIRDNKYFIFPSLICFSAAMYTFTGQRLFVPFILIILAIKFRPEIKKSMRTFLSAGLVFLILFYPLFIFTTKTIEGRLRFDEVTIFKDLDPINESIKFRQKDQFSALSSVIHNRRVFFAYEYLKNYFDAFDPTFLFFKGDVNPRLSIREIGHLYYFELPLVLLGIYYLVKRKNEFTFLILAWLLVSPLGPATARETPHALRMLHILPTFQLIAAYGLYHFLNVIRNRKILVVLLSLSVVYCISNYLHNYYVHYPKEYSGEWQYGYKEAVAVASEYYPKVDKILVSNYLGRAYIYFLFFQKTEPGNYLRSAQIIRNDLFLYTVQGYDKYTFKDDEITDKDLSQKNLLIVGSQKLPEGSEKITTIKDLNGFPVFDIGIINK